MTALEAAGDTCSKAVDALNIHLHWSRHFNAGHFNATKSTAYTVILITLRYQCFSL